MCVSLTYQKRESNKNLKSYTMKYAALQTAKKRHELGAQTLRYAGYKAKCIKNELCEQPYQVNVAGISSEEAKELQLLICKMLKDDTLNVVEA